MQREELSGTSLSAFIMGWEILKDLRLYLPDASAKLIA